ncbi:unnamed protein product [Lampetra fluviatilis]
MPVTLPVPLVSFSSVVCLKELRGHLWKEGLRGIHYLIVNDNSSASLARYERLKAQVPPAIPVLQHAPNDTDVWSTLGGTKDDFFIYDRHGGAWGRGAQGYTGPVLRAARGHKPLIQTMKNKNKFDYLWQ